MGGHGQHISNCAGAARNLEIGFQKSSEEHLKGALGGIQGDGGGPGLDTRSGARVGLPETYAFFPLPDMNRKQSRTRNPGL